MEENQKYNVHIAWYFGAICNTIGVILFCGFLLVSEVFVQIKAALTLAFSLWAVVFNFAMISIFNVSFFLWILLYW